MMILGMSHLSRRRISNPLPLSGNSSERGQMRLLLSWCDPRRKPEVRSSKRGKLREWQE
jgi:hypothetical protein